MEFDREFWQQYQDEIEESTYSPDDDKLRIYSGYVSAELFEALRKEGFQRAPIQGCFFAVWTPWREDVAVALGGAIKDDAEDMFARAEAKEERLSTYADNAARRAGEAARASERAVEGIPLGQPVLVAHYSEGMHRRALKRARDAASKAVKESRRSDYWAERASASVAHAKRKYAPPAILRRLNKLEAARRKQQKRGTPFSMRWVEHIDGQITFWKAVYLEITGKSVDDQLPIKKGGWVEHRLGAWALVVRVNHNKAGRISTVTIDPDTGNARAQHVTWRRWGYDDIRRYESRLEDTDLTSDDVVTA